MNKKWVLAGSLAAWLLVYCGAAAGLVRIVEYGLDGDTPAATASNFGEDQLVFSDRTHQHNGAAFDNAGVLSTSGSNVVPLPSYLVGNEYVQFANNARDNVDYSATVIADQQMMWYLLIDNRLNGLTGDNSSSLTTDPQLGGSLQWVLDGNWQRVNTGISPNGQGGYTAVDEGGDGVGPGQGIDNFYSVYQFSIPMNVVTVFSNGFGGNNMISLVAAPVVPEPSSAILASLGLVGLLFWFHKRR